MVRDPAGLEVLSRNGNGDSCGFDQLPAFEATKGAREVSLRQAQAAPQHLVERLGRHQLQQPQADGGAGDRARGQAQHRGPVDASAQRVGAVPQLLEMGEHRRGMARLDQVLRGPAGALPGGGRAGGEDMDLVAAALGFATCVVAHNLATEDTLEMMQAVLDTNFWLAVHVTTVTLGYTATFVAGLIAVAVLALMNLSRFKPR